MVCLTWTGLPPPVVCHPDLLFEVSRPMTSALSPHLQPPAMFHTTSTLCPGGGDRWLSHPRSKLSLGQPDRYSKATWLALGEQTIPPHVCWPRLKVCREVTQQLSKAMRDRGGPSAPFPPSEAHGSSKKPAYFLSPRSIPLEHLGRKSQQAPWSKKRKYKYQ